MAKDKAEIKRRKRLLVTITIAIAFLVVFIILISTYIFKFDKELTGENRVHLAEVSNYVASHINASVQSKQESLRSIGAAVAALPNEQERLDYLEGVAKQYSFAYIEYAGIDGLLHSTNDCEQIDISNEPNHQAAVSGQCTVSELTRKIFPNGAISGILLTVPMDDGQIKGSLTAMLDINSLGDALAIESFGGEGFSYIIDKNGTLIMRTKSLDFNNLFKAWGNMEFKDGYTLETVISDINANIDGLTCFSNMGVVQYAYYRPLEFNGWTVVNVVSQEAVSAKTIMLTRQLAIIGSIVILIFIGLMLITMRSYGVSQDRKLATDAKSAFLANMSHEIRTPMNAIVGISELLLRDKLTMKQKDQVITILNSGKGLLTIINDILDISKIESGKFEITDEPYEFESMLYDLTAIAAIRIGDKPIEFLVELDSTLPRILIGDMGRVKQVLLNIVGNAIKFTQTGSIRLIISAVANDSDLNLRIEVKDTGIGIHEEDISKLFVSFNQVDTRRNRNIEGTGLGLAISKKLAEMMSGDIQIESEYGVGSSFIITIKQAVGDKTPMISSVDKNVLVLLYETSEILRNYEASCMDKLGVEYEFSETRFEFENKLHNGNYTHAIARRAIIRCLDNDDQFPNTHLIGLLGLSEHALIDIGKLNIYIPLFSTQLPVALAGNGDNAHMLKRTGLNVDMIEPMPYVSILIVDDNEVNVQVAEGLMEPYGMEMCHAYSGKAAIDVLKKRHFDLVFMDHMMPGMDGVEATKIIRELSDDFFKKMPVIALTANTTAEARQVFIKNGFNGFLAKPIETQKLNQVLRKWLKELNDIRSTEQPVKSLPVKVLPVNPTKAYDVTLGEVDFYAGINRTGSLSVYLKVLDTYLRSTDERLLALKSWLNTDTERFVIEVHGLKSASAAIGADGFSDMAKQLENQGRCGKIDEVEANLPDFLEIGKIVLSEVSEFLNTEGAAARFVPNTTEIIPVSSVQLTEEILLDFEKSFTNYDTTRLEELFEKWEPQIESEDDKELLAELQQYYEDYEFELPINLIRKFTKHSVDYSSLPLDEENISAKKYIVIVDDNPVNLDLAEAALSQDYKLTKLISGEQLLKFLTKVKPDMILLDIRMPGLDGYQTITAIKKHGEWSDIPVIFLTGQDDIESEREGFRLGAQDFIKKPFDTVVMLSRIRSQLELYSYQTELKQLVNNKTQEIEDLQHIITVSWAEVIESRDGTTGNHVRNTTKYFKALLSVMCEIPEYNKVFSLENENDLLRASSLHDIGKIGISDTVLKKPDKLSTEEFEQMKLHAKIGADMIKKIIDNTRPDKFLLYAYDMALYHHERWNGTGYPVGLKNSEIPIHVQLLTIADVFDALTAIRPYKRAFTLEESLEIMCKDRGNFYSPELFDIFLDNIDKIKYVLEHK